MHGHLKSVVRVIKSVFGMSDEAAVLFLKQCPRLNAIVDEFTHMPKADLDAMVDIAEYYRKNVWMTITIGTHPTSSALRKDLRSKCAFVNDDKEKYKAWDAWGVSDTKKEVHLIKVSPRDLNCPKKYIGEQISCFFLFALEKYKISYCTPEMVFQLRMQYEDQPEDEVAYAPVHYWPVQRDEESYADQCPTHGFALYRRSQGKKSSLVINCDDIPNDTEADTQWIFVQEDTTVDRGK